MNAREKYVGSKEEFYFFLKDQIIKLFKEKLKIEGTRVLIPDDEKLDYEFNYVKDEKYGNLSIKVTWGQKKPQEDEFFNEFFKEFSKQDIEQDVDVNIQGNIQQDSSMVIDKVLTMDKY
ncbi:hypothetical protein [Clostridium sp.]|jgi:hypothetical protein|uniref:hypothetical protein n=1 Tax=Clostridium sp. TaxID=1506 RepID=UPI003EEF56DE